MPLQTQNNTCDEDMTPQKIMAFKVKTQCKLN